MQNYSIFNLIKNAFSGHKNWDLAWKDPTPKKEYDVVIIGGGGHGLATAYYLAKEHNITNVAIIEKGWIGGGNVGRNTTIIRSNYMHDDNALFSEFGMDLNSKAVYEINSDEHHDHMVDVDTGKVMEFHDEELEKLQHEIANKKGYELVDHSMILHVRKIES